MMKNTHFKSVMAIVIAAFLIVAMQMIQSGSEMPSFKFWICFVVILSALTYMVYVTFHLARQLRQARKEINRLLQQESDLKQEDMCCAKTE